MSFFDELPGLQIWFVQFQLAWCLFNFHVNFFLVLCILDYIVVFMTVLVCFCCGYQAYQIKFGWALLFSRIGGFLFLFIGFQLRSVWYVTHMAFGVLRRVPLG